MRLILTEDVPHLGSLGDEVLVKDGYGRNFLLPRGKAIMAGSRQSGHVEHQKRRLEILRQEAMEAASSESEKVAALDLMVRAKAGPSGRLFGSVTNRDIQAILAEQGYSLDRRSIIIQTPIKSVGLHKALVKLHTEVKVEITLRVEAIDAVEAEPGEEGESSAKEGESSGEEGESSGEEALEADAAEAAASDGGAEAVAEGGERPEGEAAESSAEGGERPAGEAAESSAEAAPEAAPEEDGEAEAGKAGDEPKAAGETPGEE